MFVKHIICQNKKCKKQFVVKNNNLLIIEKRKYCSEVCRLREANRRYLKKKGKKYIRLKNKRFKFRNPKYFKDYYKRNKEKYKKNKKKKRSLWRYWYEIR